MKFLRSRTSDDPERDPAASMALLQEVMDPPLDPGYTSWSDAREKAGLPRSTGGRTVLMLVAAIIFGFLLSVAAQTLRTPDPVAAATRQQLQERIEMASQVGDDRAAQIEILRAEIADLQKAVAQPRTGQDQRLSAAQRAGATAVMGEGVVLTLNDPPLTADSEDGERVLARDLQVIVNGLWANGAEAISINEQRLTATSTIRFAGEAIVVDLRALARPYEVRVIGPQDQLLDELSTGATGDYLGELRSQFRISVEVAPDDEVTVPAGSRLSTRVARVHDATSTTEDSS
ncbi:DUF881 domain-containing protein [Ornithinimicrobium sp. F0845]|uniref:DUF881 domain-containing protein n=1 Tax=Ornithinimicrobium sp. F0845 TaxID=2926412 RepID=UPI001FF55A8C|nr:DUF881 domain-containing protein [Ornithinimicrobium sp. F0845]